MAAVKDSGVSSAAVCMSVPARDAFDEAGEYKQPGPHSTMCFAVPLAARRPLPSNDRARKSARREQEPDVVLVPGARSIDGAQIPDDGERSVVVPFLRAARRRLSWVLWRGHVRASSVRAWRHGPFALRSRAIRGRVHPR